MPTHNETHQTTRPAEALDVMGRLEAMLDFWRAHVDEFLVQLDLAHMEIRDKVAAREEAAEVFSGRLEKRIAEFRGSLADQREVVAGIQQGISAGRIGRAER